MGMKLPLLLFSLLIAFACRPRYDFSKERANVKSELKSDSLVYQTSFGAADTAWHKNGKNALPGNEGLTISVDTVGLVVTETAPAGSILYDYAATAKVKIVLRDSTDLGYAGLLFDCIDSAYYRMLCISNKGTFYLKDVCNSEEEVLIPKITSRYLNKGRNAWNTIGIRHRRKEIHILFNGSLAAICKINKAFSYGAVGLVAATTENNKQYSPVRAVFESFSLKKMKAE